MTETTDSDDVDGTEPRRKHGIARGNDAVDEIRDKVGDDSE